LYKVLPEQTPVLLSVSNTVDNQTSLQVVLTLTGGAVSETFKLDDFTLEGSVSCIQPSIFNVAGGGSYCFGGPGVTITLSGSENGVDYQLKNGGVDVGSPISGTGGALNFNNITGARYLHHRSNKYKYQLHCYHEWKCNCGCKSRCDYSVDLSGRYG
jgi:hypothetical protein